ncbi:MAG: hypothetical protein DWQ04_21710 [Chloroflexi bacterium]|nr:MAG: hypothetical protein DWQ04_21710 [Chloroflexota bacterium]
MHWRRYFRLFRLFLIVALFLLALAPEWPIFGDEAYQLRAIVSGSEFDFLTWETEAFLVKGEAILADAPQYLPEDTQKQIVLDFLALVADIQRLDAEIEKIYVDPAIDDPEVASAALQKNRVRKRAAMAEVQPVAEAIVQNQVGTILAEQGFGVWGQAWPPVMMHMTPLPTLLMVSPRDRIERIHSYSLRVDLSTPEHEGVETAVTNQLNLSALVVPIGGLGTYPAMIQETSNLNWFVEVVAHEWSHHWMSIFPVGYNYTVDVQVRSINETVAGTIDKEIAALVIERYYPEFVPPPAPEPVDEPVAADPAIPPPFDFRAEMAQTRIEAERLLAEGEIDAAEMYMEARRRFFVDNGYAIRKLNQAFFAFYGAYQAEPGGAPGGDPIGPLVRDVRGNSSTLRKFMENMASVGNFADLEELAAELNG